MKQTKRPERKARRKARRAKAKTEIKERWQNVVDLDRRVTKLEEIIDAQIQAKLIDRGVKVAD